MVVLPTSRFVYFRLISFLWLLPLFVSSCAKPFVQEGKASYYSNKFQGRPMANGQPYRKGKLTAAHKTLPFGTKIKVTNQQNGKTVKVKVTDRGPHVKGRIVDLSLKAARRVDLVKAGVAPVQVKVIRMGNGAAAR